MMTIMAKTIWNAIGKRHATDPGTKDMPKSSQLGLCEHMSSERAGNTDYARLMPTPTKRTSDDTSRPRYFASQSSDWYIGTVEVSRPVPMPAMMRPTIMWGTL